MASLAEQTTLILQNAIFSVLVLMFTRCCIYWSNTCDTHIYGSHLLSHHFATHIISQHDLLLLVELWLCASPPTNLYHALSIARLATVWSQAISPAWGFVL